MKEKPPMPRTDDAKAATVVLAHHPDDGWFADIDPSDNDRWARAHVNDRFDNALDDWVHRNGYGGFAVMHPSHVQSWLAGGPYRLVDEPTSFPDDGRVAVVKLPADVADTLTREASRELVTEDQ